MGILSDIKYAVKNRLRVTIYYAGDESVKPGIRIIDCYATGALKGSGKKGVLAFLRSGVSLSGNDPQWRTFRIDRIRSVQVTANVFPIRSSYIRYPKQFASVDIQL